MAPTYADELARRLVALCAGALRQPIASSTDSATGDPILIFDPPLSTEERAVYARLLRLARSRVTGISPAEWQALEPSIDEMRTFRTRTPAEWSAMTAAQRDNALIAWCRDITDVLRAMLRD